MAWNIAHDSDAILNAIEEDNSDIDISDSDDEWNEINVPFVEESSTSSEESEDDAEETASGPTWTVFPFPSKDFPCIQNSAIVIEEPRTPAMYFEKYFTEDFYETAAQCTSQYYQQKLNKELRPSPTPIEIKKFFGIHGLLGCIKFPRIKMIWSSRFRFHPIASVMSRDRFQLLRVNLHVVDRYAVTEEAKKENKLWKVQPVIDFVRKRCLEIEREDKYYSIDEQMIPFTGRCAMKQYVPGKPRPVGLKNFVFTTSSGLMMDFEVYQGPTTNLPERDGIGLAPSIVLRLIRTLPKGCSVYFDRYFTTLPLMDKLLKDNVEGTGTLQNNRFRDYTFLKDSKMKRGEHEEITRSDKAVGITKWKDTKSVLLVSTCTGAEPVSLVQRWDKKDKKYVDVTCPSVVKKYNEKMGGVDTFDQLMEIYRTWYKTKKWTLKVILHFFDCAIVNAWQEYRCDCSRLKMKKKDIMDLLGFRLTIAEYLMGGPKRKRTSDRFEEPEDAALPPLKHMVNRPAPIPTVDKRLDGYNHWPSVDKLKAPLCCRLKGCSSRSRVRCQKCNVYLCLNKHQLLHKISHRKVA